MPGEKAPMSTSICLCGYPPHEHDLVERMLPTIHVTRIIVESLEDVSNAEHHEHLVRVNDGAEDVFGRHRIAVFIGTPNYQLVLLALKQRLVVLLLHPLTLDRSELLALYRTAELYNTQFYAWNPFQHEKINEYALGGHDEMHKAIQTDYCTSMSMAQNAALAYAAMFPRSKPFRVLTTSSGVFQIENDKGSLVHVYVRGMELDMSAVWKQAIEHILHANVRSNIGMDETTALYASDLVSAMESASCKHVGWVSIPSYRVYVQGITPERVVQLYRQQRSNQSYTIAKQLREKYCSGGNLRCTVWDALQLLRKIVDKSDPDVLTLANDAHALQTAAILERDGFPDSIVAMGLIHDIGKIMILFGRDEDGTSEENQWAVVGDTFITGHPIPDCVPFPEFNCLNPDKNRPSLSIYTYKCGLSNVVCSFGHDEYLYQALCRNKHHHQLNEECLYIARYHSLYAWHTGHEYEDIEDHVDRRMKPWVRRFQAADLYSKKDTLSESWDNPKWRELVERVFGTSEWDW